jgi:hypothetical protein
MRWRLALLGLLVAGIASAQSRYPDTSVWLTTEGKTLRQGIDAGDLGGGDSLNTPLDLDGDTFPDYILVSDYDGDGTLELIDDLDAAYDAVRIGTGDVSGIDAVDAATCGEVNDCFVRDDGGSFITDGFVAGHSIWFGGHSIKRVDDTQGLAALSAATCATGTDACITRTSGSWVTDGFLAGQTVYLHLFKLAFNSDEGCLVTGVTATDLNVQCKEDLTDETADSEAIVWSEGNNGLYTIVEVESASEMSVSRVGAAAGAELVVEVGDSSQEKIIQTEPILMEIAPGTYTTTAIIAPPGNGGDGANGAGSFFKIDGFTTVRGAGIGVTILRGNGGNNADVAVLGNGDTGSVRDREINLSDLTVDGGWSTTPTTPTQANIHMGVMIRGVNGYRAANIDSRNHGHACFYSSDIQNFRWENLRAQNCGDYANLASATTQACYYLHGSGYRTVQGKVSDASAYQCGSAGFNTRRESLSQYTGQIQLSDIDVRATRSECFNMRSTDRVTVDGFVCDNTAGLVTTDGGTDEYGSTTTSRRLTIANGMVTRTHTNAAIFIQEYHTDTTIRGVVVDATGGAATQPCLRIDQPHRGLLLQDLTLRNCSDDGFTTAGAAANRSDGGIEGVIVDGLIVDQVGLGNLAAGAGSCILFNRAIDGWIFRNFVLRGCAEYGVRNISGEAMDNTLWDGGIIDMRWPGFIGAFTEAEVLAFDNDALRPEVWVRITNASSTTDCTVASGTGAVVNDCRWAGSAWSDASTDWAQIDGNFNAVLYSNASTGNHWRNVKMIDEWGLAFISHGAAVTNTTYENVTLEVPVEVRATVAMVPDDGIVTNVSDTGLRVRGLICDGIEDDCLEFSAGALDDFTADSDFRSGMDVADFAGACTDGQIATARDGSASTVLHVCEDALWVGK